MNDIVRPSRYSWEEKTEAAKLYMLSGNMRIVAENTGVPYDTLCDWKKADWWPTLIEELKLVKKAKSGKKIDKILELSLEEIEDRITNGDYVLNNKTGEIERRKVSMRDLANMTNQMMTRQLQMEELAEKLEHKKETVQETLNMLAKEFTKYQRLQQKQSAVDVEVKEISDAVHDQREA